MNVSGWFLPLNLFSTVSFIVSHHLDVGGSKAPVKGRWMLGHQGVAVQGKCPFKWAAEMSLGYAVMVSDDDGVGPAQGRRVGGPSASRYFLTVALWIPNSRPIARSDIPLRRAF